MRVIAQMGFQCGCGVDVSITAIALTEDGDIMLVSRCHACAKTFGVGVQKAMDKLQENKHARDN